MSETIAAISTAVQKGGIAIIRISGDKAIEIADKVFEGKKMLSDTESHKMVYGKVKDNDEVIDECLCSVMRGPKSYTAEDVVEINVHGGTVSAKRTLEAVIKAGARSAKAGEFTLRAFMNGRIDLSEAEAVSDIINSKTYLAQSTAVNQLEGKLKNKIDEIRKKVIEILSFITVSSDFPDEDPDSVSGLNIAEEIISLKKETEKIIKNADKGIILRDGAVAAICGKPNVGKSSLLNILSGEEKAIVTDIEGTTRDIIEEYVNIKDIPVRLADTAGIRENADAVEKIGVKKAIDYIKKADICLFVTDNARPFEKEDGEIYKIIKDKPVIAVVNKCDEEDKCVLPDCINDIVRVSAKTGKGIDELEDKIYSAIMGEDFSKDSIMITNSRHKEAFVNADAEIGMAVKTVKRGYEIDLASVNLERAASYLGEITGMTVSDEVIDEVFSKFCIGK